MCGGDTREIFGREMTGYGGLFNYRLGLSVKVMLKWNRDKAYILKICIFAPLQKTHLSVNSQ